MEPSKPDLGVYYQMLDSLCAVEPSLSYLAREWPDIDKWRSEARSRVQELLNFDPLQVPLNSTVDSRLELDGVVTEGISYDMPYGPRTRGFFLYPAKRDSKKKLPGVIALHDHGGFFYYGKEKIVATGVHDEVLDEFKKEHYGGRSWATELARRGFAVLSVDTFLWGSRKITIDSVNEELVGPFEGLEPGSVEFIRTFNLFWDAIESSVTVSTLLNAGTTWPGIYSYEDRRSVDYLMTRPEVDTERIACGGLSGGGLRSVFLLGLDPRIKSGFCVGFMSTIRSMLRNHIKGNGLIMYVPGLIRLLELPDIISLHGPSPLLIQYDEHDRLFSFEGQREADRKISGIYMKMGHPGNYRGTFYPGPHKFDLAMQEDAFRWLEDSLSSTV